MSLPLNPIGKMEFLSILRSLWNIDRADLPELSDDEWPAFRDHPHNFFKQASGYHRNCRSIETPRDPVTGLYRNDDPVIRESLYLDDDEEPPEGYLVSTTFRRSGAFIPLADYIARPDVCVVHAADIKPEERIGDVPREGYVWCE